MSAELDLARQFIEDHPADAASVLEQVTFGEAAALLALLDPSLASRAVGRISATLAVESLKLMDNAQVAGLLERLPLDYAARMLRRADTDTREVWLNTLPAERGEMLRRKLRFPPGTAGYLADPLVLSLPQDMLVSEAEKHMHRSAERAYYYIYVVDREQRLVGALDIRELMQAQGKQPLSEVMRRELVRLPANTDIMTLLTHPGWRDLDALPVVDTEGVFFGIVRHRTVRQLSQNLGGQAEVEPVVSALVNLGELYWTGMAAFLAGVSATGGAALPPRRSSAAKY
ncbi:MAG: magnesium transporter [Gemmatimonadetes bacterium]|nr:magnesium transporter [Gemmatimonadota bacterium]